jgi:hypothetical protein
VLVAAVLGVVADKEAGFAEVLIHVIRL